MANGRRNIRTEQVERVIVEEIEHDEGVVLELTNREAEFLSAVANGLNARQPEAMALYRALMQANVHTSGTSLAATVPGTRDDHRPLDGQVVVMRNGRAPYLTD